MKKFLAICTTASGKSFRYKDKAKDIACFAQYMMAIYPDFKIESITSLD